MNKYKKNDVRLTESQLRNMIKETVIATLSEGSTNDTRRRIMLEDKIKNTIKSAIREVIESENKNANPIIQTVLQHSKDIIEDFGDKLESSIKIGSGYEECEYTIEKGNGENIVVYCCINYDCDFDEYDRFFKDITVEPIYVYDSETDEEFDSDRIQELNQLYDAIVKNSNEIAYSFARDYMENISELETQRWLNANYR